MYQITGYFFVKKNFFSRLSGLKSECPGEKKKRKKRKEGKNKKTPKYLKILECELKCE